MMNTQEYIKSGILELYCMGGLSQAEAGNVLQMMAHKDIRNEVEHIQETLETYAEKNAVAPPAYLQDAIWSVIDNLEKEKKMDKADLPLISRYTDHNAWLTLVPKPFPATVQQQRYCETLTKTATVAQMLVISATDFEDEVHTDEHESFLILDGHCECTVEDKVIQMKAGDFMAIPLHTHHDVKVTSPYVVAILQRVAA